VLYMYVLYTHLQEGIKSTLPKAWHKDFIHFFKIQNISFFYNILWVPIVHIPNVLHRQNQNIYSLRDLNHVQEWNNKIVSIWAWKVLFSNFSDSSAVLSLKGAQVWDIRSLGFSWFLHHKVSTGGRLCRLK
jgi:hypothetical protein